MALKLGSPAVSNLASILWDSPAHKFPSSTNSNWFPPPFPGDIRLSILVKIADQAKLFISISTKCTFAGVVLCPHMNQVNTTICSRKLSAGSNARSAFLKVPRSSGSSSSEGSPEEPSDQEKVSFGYTRKDVLLISLGVTVLGVGLKYGLEFGGVDPLRAGNVVQLVLVLGLTVGWISTYLYRVSNKEMTYAQQLRDYENKVMQKRLEGLTVAELEALLEQVEEEKRRMASGEQL